MTINVHLIREAVKGDTFQHRLRQVETRVEIKMFYSLPSRFDLVYPRSPRRCTVKPQRSANKAHTHTALLQLMESFVKKLNSLNEL